MPVRRQPVGLSARKDRVGGLGAAENGRPKVGAKFCQFAWAALGILAFFSAGKIFADTATYALNGTWTVPAGVTSVSVLVVAGGGGGGGSNNFGGGGGGGGVVYQSSYATTPGAGIAVTVGLPGAGGNVATNGGLPTQGQDSAFGTLTALGGGAGASGGGNAGSSGGSGGGGNGQSGYSGGSGGTGSSGQGFAGGSGTSGSNAGGGGGGASSAGGASGTNIGGAGGNGYTTSISGPTIIYGGGGGGGGSGTAGSGGTGGGGAGSNGASPGSNGTDNIGGGGGGGGSTFAESGGNGGTGVVIISFIPEPEITSSLNAGEIAGYPFSYQIAATEIPTGFSATGLPTGLSINTTTGLISGTPATAGNYSATIGATNAIGTDTATLEISVEGSATFTSSTTWTVPTGVTSVNVLVVAGGAGGAGGGGGGGGAVVQNGFTTTPGASLAVAIGSGGSGGTTETGQTPVAISGGNSAFDSITAVGGGFGGRNNMASDTGTGGSGGGGGATSTSPTTGGAGTSGQGFSGGTGSPSSPYPAAGGGGAGGAGGNGTASNGAGGPGLPFNLGGAIAYFGGGGGGGTSSGGPVAAGGSGGGGASGVAGTANTGGGGGGGLTGGNSGTAGGSGIVFVTWPVAASEITSPAVAGGLSGVAFSYQITATNTPTIFSETGLPTGLSIDTSTGLISGVPTAAGTYDITVGATNSIGSGSQNVTLTVLESETFTSSMTWTVPAGLTNVNLLVVGGGGAGAGGGGGGGGVVLQNGFSVVPGATLAVTVGAGGGGGTTENGQTPVATSGGNSAISSLVAVGGGNGGRNNMASDAASGGSGGGGGATSTSSTAGGTSTSGQGYNGGTGTASSPYPAAGGGGAGGVGGDGSGTNGAGGPGTLSSFGGIPTYYGGGGGAGTSSGGSVALGGPGGGGNSGVAGVANSGGGGGGGLTGGNTGQAGGSGIVIASWTSLPGLTSAISASGLTGSAFSYQVTATYSPTTYAATALPPGLSLNTSTGLISGTATTAGTYIAVISETNSTGTSTEVLSIQVGSNAPSITSSSTAAGLVGSSFSYQITGTNSPTSFGATGLPSGLSINTTSGLISGTPTTAGTSSIGLSALNSPGTGTATLSLIVASGAPVISSAAAATGQADASFGYQITASNGPTSYGATGLPVGLSLDAATGLISGTPTSAGNATVTISATNSLGSTTMALSLDISLSTTGMKLWLEGDTGIALTTSGSVTTATWADQSGQGNNATQTSSSAPSLVSNSINGHDAVHFTAANSQYFTLPALLSGITSGEVFVIFRAATNTPSNPIALYQFGSGHGSAMPNTDGILYDDFLNSALIEMGPASVSLTSYNLYNVTAATGQWTSRLNGALCYTTTSNSFLAPTGSLLLGANVPFSVGDFFDGDIAEIIVYGQALTDQQRETVGEYLQSKYDLAAIPVPATPTGLSASPVSSTQVSLIWTDTFASSGVAYNIQRSAGGGYSTVGHVSNAQSFIDTGLTAGTTYSYQVFSQSYAGVSAVGSTATVLTSSSDATDMPLSGMKLWLRSDAGIDDGSAPISYWRDQSGLGNDATQFAAANGPSLVGNVVNGRPSVHFSAAASKFLNLPALMTGMTSGDLFVVFRATTNTPSSPMALYQLGPGPGSAMPSSDENLYDNFLNSTTLNMGKSPFGLTAFNLYNVSAGTSQWVSWMDCVPLFSTSTNTVQAPTGGLVLGADVPFYVGNFFDGDIAEIILYNSNLTVSQRAAVIAYLAHKYAVAIADPSVPVGFFGVVISSTQVDLVWGSDPNTAGYTIERSVDGGAWQALADINGPTNTYADSSVPSGNVIRYRIQGTNNQGSEFSDPAFAFMNPNSIDPGNGLPYWFDEVAGIDPDAGSDAIAAYPIAPSSPAAPTEDPSIHVPPTVILISPSQATLH